MNNKIFERCVEISKALKPKESTGRAFHTTFALKKSKIVCIGWNNYNKSHSKKRFGEYKNYKELPNEYKASLHSEISCLIRLGEENLADYELLNIRIDNNNQVAISKPCLNCLNVLKTVFPKKVFYSNSIGSFALLDVHNSQTTHGN